MYEIEDKKNREQYQMERSAARKDWIKNLHSDLLLKHDHELLASAGGDPVRAGGKHHAQSERFGNR